MPDRRVCVVVSSAGRPECLALLWERLRAQSRPPHRVIFAVPGLEDLPPGIGPGGDGRAAPEVVLSPRGLPRQRNRGLERALAEGAEIVAFLDDDYVPSRGALSGLARAFDAFPDASGVTGVLLADGARGPGIAPEEAARLVDAWDARESEAAREAAPPRILARLRGLYGCNMAYRASAIGGTRFDERLPLYAWQEDIDFAARVPGQKIKTDALVGVHCGVKGGRERRGERLGYSQIANPFYLWGKGTMSRRFALRLCARNVLSNHLRALRPEPWIDRRGRARGNWRALADLCRGRIDPERILALR